MNSRKIWGWWFFDWASQPFATLLTSFVFSVYFSQIAQTHFQLQGMTPEQAGAQAQALWGWGLAIGGMLIAVLAPVLGAIADGSGRRMLWIAFFSGLYVIGAAGLWWLTPDQPALIRAVAFYGIGLIGMEFATIFTNALLPDIAPRSEIGRVSGSGFAFGYLGGVIALAIMLALIAETTDGKTLAGLDPILGLDPATREGTRFVGPFTAIWYIVFMIPFALWVREAPRTTPALPVRQAMRGLVAQIRGLRHRPSLATWLGSSMLGRDALNGLYSFGGIYAGTVMGWPITLVGVFGVIAAVSGAAISWIGGRADRRWGPKPVIIASLVSLTAISALVMGLTPDSVLGVATGPTVPMVLFFVAGMVIGGAGGVMQAASRTMMVHHAAPGRATEAFGLYALSGKATAFLAPMLIALVTTFSDSQRVGMVPLIVMFLLALFLLRWVEPEGDIAP